MCLLFNIGVGNWILGISILKNSFNTTKQIIMNYYFDDGSQRISVKQRELLLLPNELPSFKYKYQVQYSFFGIKYWRTVNSLIDCRVISPFYSIIKVKDKLLGS